MINLEDTIVACATPPGSGAISSIRISGKDCSNLYKKISGKTMAHKEIHISEIELSSGIKEKCVLTSFLSPNSYTGEDTIEISCHGNPLIVELLITKLKTLDCRDAQPGEFTMRSYLNGKVSLIEAEAISDLISARSIENIKAVNKSLAGSFEKKIDELIFDLKSMRAQVEGEIDFNDQDTNIDLSEINTNLDSFRIIIEDFINITSDAVLMNEGIKTIITGPENVGKSTLMNVFTKKKTSIVSEIAGTTRDLVTKSVKIHGLVFDLMDSAGLSSRAKDKIEEIGTNLAKNALEEADLIIEVVDHNNPNYEMTYPKGKKVVKVLNKSDLAGDEKTKRINISAKYEHNITKLENCLVDAVFSSKNQVLGGFSARSRHLNLLNSCNDEILRACSLCEEFSIELCAEHLKNASGYLGQIKSPYSSDDLLGEIFSSFCIGK